MKNNWFVLILTIISGILSFLVLKQYLGYLFFAIIVVFITYPLYKKISMKIRNRSASAIILIILVLSIILIPCFYVSTVLFYQARNVFSQLSSIDFEKLKVFEGTIFSRFGVETGLAEKINSMISDFSKTAISYLTNNISGFTKTVANIFIGFFLMLFTMFYLYVDGDRILGKLKELVPMREKYREYFFSKFYRMTQALFLGIFLVAVIQGALAGMGYLAFGVNNPIFWALVTTIVAVIPILGPPWVYVPLSIYLIYKGNIATGIGLFLYSVIFVSQIDNIIRPRIVRMKADIHPLIIILGAIGGIMVFGFIGFIIGPLILVLFIEMLELYRKER